MLAFPDAVLAGSQNDPSVRWMCASGPCGAGAIVRAALRPTACAQTADWAPKGKAAAASRMRDLQVASAWIRSLVDRKTGRLRERPEVEDESVSQITHAKA